MRISLTSLALCAFTFVIVAYADEQAGTKLKLGEPIPSVAVQNQDRATLNLAQEGKNGYMLVFFYPRALTRGCTAQACSLRDAYNELQGKGVKVFGVSSDPAEKQKEFIVANTLPFQLLADTEMKVIDAFGVPLLNNSMASRQAYLFRDGKLVWLDTKASTAKQAEDVLSALANLPTDK
ncbi:MAG: peroxiredoxin [Holophagales bacterium]|jgi:peroxiredoxin Q/BCP|nr:peroxiredoxin [Holophagales bacterium]